MYFNYLYDQFRKANGLEKLDLNSKKFMEDFSYWLKDMKKRGEIYLEFLESIGINIDCYDVAEIGKGKSDSIVQDLTTTIVTPYPEGINRNGFEYSRLITARLKIFDGIPTFISRDKLGNRIIDDLSPSMFSLFMMQNPYTPNHLKCWEELHNNSNSNILVGVFGSIYDKDSVHKLEELNSLKNKLIGSYYEDYGINGDTYTCIVISDKSRKKIRKK